MARKVKLISS